MSIVIAAMRTEHIKSFHAALDIVAREHAYLTLLEAPPIAELRKFIEPSMAAGAPHIVALNGARVVGWCDVTVRAHPTTRHCGVLGMGLVPEWRGRGVGLRLIERAIAAARAHGLARIELQVRRDNPRALALYQKVGFAIEGCRRRALLVDGVYHDLTLMALLLDAAAPGAP
ncbi:MAG TPA: GNAT family N-acetyltransferase [Hyphomicrobiaceae bacterium]|nr:GNAT family N-acetyltransferase [Hyphomicrobiaceae bacterium]